MIVSLFRRAVSELPLYFDGAEIILEPLGAALKVTQIGEQKVTVIAFAVNAARQANGLASMIEPKFATCMGTVRVHRLFEVSAYGTD